MTGPTSSDEPFFWDDPLIRKKAPSQPDKQVMDISEQPQPYDAREMVDRPDFVAPSCDHRQPATELNKELVVQNHYPVDSFPTILKNVICALHEDTQIPIEIIGSAVLATSALACQSHIDVISPRDDGHREPCILFVLVLAKRGGGKSPIYRKVMRPFYQFLEQTELDYQEKQKIYESELEDWKERDDALKSLRKKAIRKGEDGESENKRRAEFKKPSAPRKFSIIFENTTLKDMFEKLEQYPYAGIFSEEAGSFTKGYLKRNLEFLDKVWSGDAYSHSRPGESSLNIKAWISILLMVQPSIFRKFLGKEGSDALDIGFVDRLLISVTNSDENNSDNDDYSKSNAALNVFHKAIWRLLIKQKSNFDNASENKKTLSLSNSANKIRKENSREIISKPKQEQEWKHMGEFVQKAESNAIRIAAIFTHMNNNESTVIDDLEISNAYEIVRWHLKKANEFLYLSPENEQFEQDVRKVYSWLKVEFHSNDYAPIMFNHLRQRAPNKLRDSSKLRFLFDQLISQDKIILAQTHPNGALYVLPVSSPKNIFLNHFNRYYYITEKGEQRLIIRIPHLEEKYIPLRANPSNPQPKENDFFTILQTSKNTRSISPRVDLSDL